MEKKLELELAVALMGGSVTALSPRTAGLQECLGCILDESVVAPMDQPPFPRSPLDGYAFTAADSAGAGRQTPVTLRVVDKVFAGEVCTAEVKRGQAVRIMTGAMIPPGADCVLRQEDSDQGEAEVKIYARLRPFQNYCRQGEDFRRGSVLLQAGTRLDSAAVGLLAAAGIPAVKIRARPRAGLLTTGDELVAPGAPLGPGKIYDCNQTALSARLRELGIPAVCDRGKDDARAAAEQMKALLAETDLLITTGGVSVGQRDMVNEALSLMGAETVFHGVRLKPGSPARFSVYGGKPILSLSGNPFAALATLELLGRPLLAALAGDRGLLPARREGTLASHFPKASPGRRFVRGSYEDGQVVLPQEHSSGQMASLPGCNCLADIPAGSGPLTPGMTVAVILY